MVADSEDNGEGPGAIEARVCVCVCVCVRCNGTRNCYLLLRICLGLRMARSKPRTLLHLAVVLVSMCVILLCRRCPCWGDPEYSSESGTKASAVAEWSGLPRRAVPPAAMPGTPGRGYAEKAALGQEIPFLPPPTEGTVTVPDQSG